ncbi:MAG: transcription-repair coupling factor [Thermoanaerobaculia bacterium]
MQRVNSSPMSGDETWRDLSGKLRASEAYRELRQRLGPVVHLPLAAAAWVCELLARDLDRSLLVVVPREADALGWLEMVELCGGTGAFFSAPSLSPYQETEVSLPVRAQEAVALDRVLSGEVRTLVCTPRALFRRLPEPEEFSRALLEIGVGQEQPIEALVEHLSSYGYRRSDLVGEVGDFAVRGGVFDLFPPGEAGPVRLDLFGDTVESIRRFDVEDQRSRDHLEAIRVLPLSLFRAGPDEATRLAELLTTRLGDEAGMDANDKMEDLRRRGRFIGWEHYLPLLAEKTVSLTDLAGPPLVVGVDPEVLEAEIAHHERRLAADFEARHSVQRLAVPPELLEQPAAAVREVAGGCEVTIEDVVAGGSPEAIDFEGSTTDIFHRQLPRFPREIETAKARSERLLVVAPAEHWSRLEQWCETFEIPRGHGGLELVTGELQRGFRLPPAGVVVFAEQQLFARLAPERPRPRRRFGPFVSGLRDLRAGDFIVHTDHGIGQFMGLRSIGEKEGMRQQLPPSLVALGADDSLGEVEVMEVAYKGDRNLLLPLSHLDLIQKYSGIEGIAPRLDRLGGSSWSRTKERIKKGLRKLAGDLLRHYAERHLAKAAVMPADSDLQAQFDAAFDFEETEDQLEAIAAIKADLERQQPMDRLLCGDVGFGKTEVAMRAAFKVVDGGYQVAVLAPTTILADQHLETFRARFSGFPVEIEMVSRGRSGREMREIRRRLASNKLDILIGTHRLLGSDIDFQRLGLLVVDEEQRFGVAQKERMLELKKSVHVLAMSATPVPRTLQLSLAGVRDLSVIETPPRDRMAVETAILPFSAELIREAIEFELERSGQVYYVYNRVEGIEEMARQLRQVVPGLRLTVGHGQLNEAELARRMRAFKGGEFDLLLATTIIENGIDISNVNTMIVHRADRFGLAQLYQLRGRVGRSNQLAYCYLLVPTGQALSEEARQRLGAIRDFTELGAGFRVAARDLEIRGAGNLLGAEQSGHISALGIETYLKMLRDAVKELRGEAVEEGPSVALDLSISTAIPHEYIEDANLRMDVYRQIASGEVADEEILAELRDRFGAPPPAVDRLLEVASLKRLAESLRAQSISVQGAKLQIRLRRDAHIDLDRLVRLVSSRPGASFSPTGVLIVERSGGESPTRLAREILEELRG